MSEPLSPLAVSTPEAAKMIGGGQSQIYSLMGDGQLSSAKIGSRRVIAVSALKQLVER